jgi:hypothetical protein
MVTTFVLLFTIQVEGLLTLLLVQSACLTIHALLSIREQEVLLRGRLVQVGYGVVMLVEGVGSCLLSHVFCDGIVLLNELIDGHVASAHSDHKIVTLEIHDHLALEEAVVTF